MLDDGAHRPGSGLDDDSRISNAARSVGGADMQDEERHGECARDLDVHAIDAERGVEQKPAQLLGIGEGLEVTHHEVRILARKRAQGADLGAGLSGAGEERIAVHQHDGVRRGVDAPAEQRLRGFERESLATIETRGPRGSAPPGHPRNSAR